MDARRQPMSMPLAFGKPSHARAVSRFKRLQLGVGWHTVSEWVTQYAVQAVGAVFYWAS